MFHCSEDSVGADSIKPLLSDDSDMIELVKLEESLPLPTINVDTTVIEIPEAG